MVLWLLLLNGAHGGASAAGGSAASRFLFGHFHIPMVNAFMIAQAVQRAVDTFADVTHRLLGWSHVNVLNVALEASQ